MDDMCCDRMFELKGDGDLDPQNGFIEVDTSEPRAPVVRFRADRLPKGGGGGMAGGMADDMGCFRVVRVYEDEEDVEEGEAPALTNVYLANCYYLRGATFMTDFATGQDGTIEITDELAIDQEPTGAIHKIVAIIMSAQYGVAQTPALTYYASIAALEAATKEPATVVMPLYAFDKGGVVLIDFRRMPCAQMGEVFA